MATDGNGRYCYLDPYLGGMIAVAEACRNVSAMGAEPVAVPRTSTCTPLMLRRAGGRQRRESDERRQGCPTREGEEPAHANSQPHDSPVNHHLWFRASAARSGTSPSPRDERRRADSSPEARHGSIRYTVSLRLGIYSREQEVHSGRGVRRGERRRRHAGCNIGARDSSGRFADCDCNTRADLRAGALTAIVGDFPLGRRGASRDCRSHSQPSAAATGMPSILSSPTQRSLPGPGEAGACRRLTGNGTV